MGSHQVLLLLGPEIIVVTITSNVLVKNADLLEVL